MRVKIIDDFLEEALVNYIQHVVIDLKYNVHSSAADLFNFFASDGDFIDDRIFDYIFDKITCIPSIKINKLLRSYVNINCSGKGNGGRFHYDDGKITALYYPCDWESHYGGGLEFVDDRGISNIVEYKKNRLVLFDTIIKHQSLDHTNENLRYSVAYKLDAKWC